MKPLHDHDSDSGIAITSTRKCIPKCKVRAGTAPSDAQHAPLDDPILSHIRKQRPEDNISKSIASIPQPGATLQFDSFMREASVGDQFTIRYLWGVRLRRPSECIGAPCALLHGAAIRDGQRGLLADVGYHCWKAISRKAHRAQSAEKPTLEATFASCEPPALA